MPAVISTAMWEKKGQKRQHEKEISQNPSKRLFDGLIKRGNDSPCLDIKKFASPDGEANHLKIQKGRIRRNYANRSTGQEYPALCKIIEEIIGCPGPGRPRKIRVSQYDKDKRVEHWTAINDIVKRKNQSWLLTGKHTRVVCLNELHREDDDEGYWEFLNCLKNKMPEKFYKANFRASADQLGKAVARFTAQQLRSFSR